MRGIASKSSSVFLLSCLICAAQAHGHARWKVGSELTPPRNDATGLKTEPCGGVPRTAVASQFRPGQQITVEFEETIQHTSYFIISFSPTGDTGFAQNVLAPRIADDKSGQGDLNHQFTATITLPNVKCTDCTLQLIQVMMDSAQGLNGPETGRYYSCSDIQLVDNPMPRPKPTPTPSPTGSKVAPSVPKNIKIERN